MIVQIYLNDGIEISNNEAYVITSTVIFKEDGRYTIEDLNIIKDVLCENCGHSAITEHQFGQCNHMLYNDDRGSKMCSCNNYSL